MTGAILWKGRSLINREPIVVIGTDQSANTKTGPMIQTWILCQRLDPVQAIKRGQDKAVCGDCKLRGIGLVGRRCYVVVPRAPLGVWKAWRRGAYLKTPPAHWAHQPIRIGAYGDPAAVPLQVWQDLVKDAPKWSGYTHQWRKAKAQPYRDLVMASCDTIGECRQAADMGWRVFYAKFDGANVDDLPFVTCPASREAGHKTRCARCGLCSGLGADSAPHVMIEPHGSARRSQ